MQRYKGVWIAIIFLIIASLACSLSASDRNEKQDSGGAGSVQESQTTTVALSSSMSDEQVPTSLPQQLTIDADAEEQLLINIYERVNPAVVRCV
jgi:hypothetical protein